MTPPVVAVSSVARAAPRVRGRLARHGDELPGVGPITQRELQHAVYARNAHLAVGDRRAEGVSTRSPSRADHELANPTSQVGGPAGRLGGEPLVVVLVSREHDLRAGVVQRLPQRLGLRHAAVCVAGAGPRVMPVSEGAALGMRGEVSPKPLVLGRARAHGDVAVEGYDVPGAEIVAVVSLGGIARRGAEVAE